MEVIPDLKKCKNCNVKNREKALLICSRCKAVHYCSAECQKKDWKSHKNACNYNAKLEEGLKKHENTLGGTIERLTLPDGVSRYELDQRLEKWVKFYSVNLMAACESGLRLPENIDNALKQVLYVKLRGRAHPEHRGDVGKLFAVEDAYPLLIEEAMTWRSPWPESLLQLKDWQDKSGRLGRGRYTAVMVECPPLAVQTVPYGSLFPTSFDPVIKPDWKEILVDDVLHGRQIIYTKS